MIFHAELEMLCQILLTLVRKGIHTFLGFIHSKHAISALPSYNPYLLNLHRCETGDLIPHIERMTKESE